MNLQLKFQFHSFLLRLRKSTKRTQRKGNPATHNTSPKQREMSEFSTNPFRKITTEFESAGVLISQHYPHYSSYIQRESFLKSFPQFECVKMKAIKEKFKRESKTSI